MPADAEGRLKPNVKNGADAVLFASESRPSLFIGSDIERPIPALVKTEGRSVAKNGCWLAVIVLRRLSKGDVSDNSAGNGNAYAGVNERGDRKPLPFFDRRDRKLQCCRT